jgi:transcriptional regulator with XRE-family HTH domain
MARKERSKRELEFIRLLGGRICAHREHAGLSQKQLAESFDPPLTRQQIANIELGFCSPSAFRIVHIADALGVAVQELVR